MSVGARSWQVSDQLAQGIRCLFLANRFPDFFHSWEELNHFERREVSISGNTLKLKTNMKRHIPISSSICELVVQAEKSCLQRDQRVVECRCQREACRHSCVTVQKAPNLGEHVFVCETELIHSASPSNLLMVVVQPEDTRLEDGAVSACFRSQGEGPQSGFENVFATEYIEFWRMAECECDCSISVIAKYDILAAIVVNIHPVLISADRSKQHDRLLTTKSNRARLFQGEMRMVCELRILIVIPHTTMDS